jgi:hypothetical protein
VFWGLRRNRADDGPVVPIRSIGVSTGASSAPGAGLKAARAEGHRADSIDECEDRRLAVAERHHDIEACGDLCGAPECDAEAVRAIATVAAVCLRDIERDALSSTPTLIGERAISASDEHRSECVGVAAPKQKSEPEPNPLCQRD